jgi:hypothetical protein
MALKKPIDREPVNLVLPPGGYRPGLETMMAIQLHCWRRRGPTFPPLEEDIGFALIALAFGMAVHYLTGGRAR